MNRKDLIAKLVAQGVSEENAPSVADSILADHSKIASDLRSKLSDSESKIKSLEDSENGLKEQLEANKATSDELTKAQVTIEELNGKLTSAEEKVSQGDTRLEVLNEVVKANPHDPQDVMKFIDVNKVTRGEDGTLQIGETIKALQESKSYLFQGELTQQGYKPNSSNGNLPPKDKENTAEMSYEDIITKSITAQLDGRTQTNQTNPMNVQD